jgi:intracellular septation protein
MVMSPKLRFALDMGPLLLFFLSYRFAGLMAATATLIAFTAISLAITYAKEKRISPMPLVSGLAVTVFGTMTLLLNDEYFIKIKPTLVNLLFASILLGGLAFKKPLLKYVLESAVHMTDKGWSILSLRWGFFFIFLAGLNEFVWRNYPTDFWVNFKVFGMFTCTMAFMLLQIPLMKRHMTPAPNEQP